MSPNLHHPHARHSDVLRTALPFSRVQVSPSGSPLHHLFLQQHHLHVASIGQEDAFVLGDTRAQREGAHPSIPALIPPLRRPRRGPLSACACLDGWSGGRDWGALHMALQQNEPIDEGNRLALSVPDGYTPLPPARPPLLPLPFNQPKTIPLSRSLQSNCPCVVDLREWQKPLLGNLCRKGEVVLSVVLFLVGIRLGCSLLALFSSLAEIEQLCDGDRYRTSRRIE